MTADAEKFLLKCITKHDVDTFDELHLLSIDNKSSMRNIWSLILNALCQHLITSDSIYCTHICSVIYGYTVFLENIDLDPLEHGYRLTEDSKLVPIISTKLSFPSNFPQSCNCQKSSKVSVCKCRLLEICCCQFCKCDASLWCKNPVKCVKTPLNWTDVCYVYHRFCYIYFDCLKLLCTCLDLKNF